MKVLHLITSLKVGGAESSLSNLLSKLDAKEHVVICFHSGPNLDRIKELGIQVFQVKGAFSPYDPLGVLRLFKLIRALNPDLIHSALWSANFLGSIVAKFYKIPIICDLHGDVANHGKIRSTLDRLIINIPETFIAVSSSVQGSFKHPRVITIPNGVDVSSIRNKVLSSTLDRSTLGLSENSFVFGTVGRLVPVKDQKLLLNAFKDVSQEHNAQLCIVGDGPMKDTLKELAFRLGISDKVIFLGERSDSIEISSLFDCFVLSSRSEGLSIALLEAMSAGLPVITTCKDKYHDVIEDQVSGLLVLPNNKEQLSFAMHQVCSNQSLLNRLKSGSLQRVKTKFNMTNMVNSYIDLYEKIYK